MHVCRKDDLENAGLRNPCEFESPAKLLWSVSDKYSSEWYEPHYFPALG